MSRLTLQKEHLDAYARAVKRGVTAHALTSIKESTPERVRQWRKRGIQVRMLDELPMRVSIYDDKGMVFRFFHNKEYISVHIVNERLAKGMNSFFDVLWKIAKKQ